MPLKSHIQTIFSTHARTVSATFYNISTVLTSSGGSMEFMLSSKQCRGAPPGRALFDRRNFVLSKRSLQFSLTEVLPWFDRHPAKSSRCGATSPEMANRVEVQSPPNASCATPSWQLSGQRDVHRRCGRMTTSPAKPMQ